MDDTVVTIDLEKQKTCKHEKQTVINHSLMWHDGDVVCVDCGKWIREFDAG